MSSRESIDAVYLLFADVIHMPNHTRMSNNKLLLQYNAFYGCMCGMKFIKTKGRNTDGLYFLEGKLRRQ